jgi:hypothetical protein
MLLFKQYIFLPPRNNNMVLQHSVFSAIHGYYIVVISKEDERIAIPVFADGK